MAHDDTPRPFNPNSTDSMFSRIMTRLEQQDAAALEHRTALHQSIKDGLGKVEKLDARVAVVERWQDIHKAKVALAVFTGSLLVSGGAWAIGLLWK